MIIEHRWAWTIAMYLFSGMCMLPILFLDTKRADVLSKKGLAVCAIWILLWGPLALTLFPLLLIRDHYKPRPPKESRP